MICDKNRSFTMARLAKKSLEKCSEQILSIKQTYKGSKWPYEFCMSCLWTTESCRSCQFSGISANIIVSTKVGLNRLSFDVGIIKNMQCACGSLRSWNKITPTWAFTSPNAPLSMIKAICVISLTRTTQKGIPRRSMSLCPVSKKLLISDYWELQVIVWKMSG